LRKEKKNEERLRSNKEMKEGDGVVEIDFHNASKSVSTSQEYQASESLFRPVQ
jgi:hypothetical protein